MSARVLSLPALASYGALGLPLAAAALPVYVHLPNLYGGILGMNLALLGGLLLAMRLGDAFIDPLIGVLNDRLQRPRLVVALGALLLAGGLLAAFNPPQEGFPLWLWLAAALLPVYLGYSLASVSYLAWGALLGDTPHERTRVAASREGFGLLGVVLASVAPALLAPTLDAGLARYALLAAAVIAVFVVNGVAAALPATLVLFFVDDALRLPQHAGLFLAAYFVSGAASLPLWVGAARRYGKARAWLASMLLAVLAFVGAFALGAGDLAGFLAVCVASGAALGADLALPPAMLADAIRARGDDSRAGAYFGIWNLATKANLALAAGLALPLIGWLGYVPGDSSSVAPLYYAYCLLPCALKLVGAALLWRGERIHLEVRHA